MLGVILGKMRHGVLNHYGIIVKTFLEICMKKVTASEYSSRARYSIEKRASDQTTAAEFLMNNPGFLEKHATWLGTAANWIQSGIKTVGNRFGANAEGVLRGDAAAAKFAENVRTPLAAKRTELVNSEFWKNHHMKVKGAGLFAGGMATGKMLSGGNSQPQPQPRQIPPPVAPIGR